MRFAHTNALLFCLLLSTTLTSAQGVEEPHAYNLPAGDAPYLPPPPNQAQPLTELYLNRLNSNGAQLPPPPAHPSRSQRPPENDNRPHDSTFAAPQDLANTNRFIDRSSYAPPPLNWNPPQNPSITPPGLPPQMSSPDNLGLPSTSQPQRDDLNKHLPPKLAKQRTTIRRNSRMENHALLGELMTAQDALEDVMALERPEPEVVGQAYARIFDIQRRVIELRVRTRNALLSIWDKARKDLKTSQTSAIEQ